MSLRRPGRRPAPPPNPARDVDRPPGTPGPAGSDAGLGITIWGARGSIPASGPDFVRYGGETCAVEVRAGARTLVCDAGSGLVAMGRSLVERGLSEIDILLSHLHHDHLMGLPFFAPMHCPNAHVRIHVGGAPTDGAARETLAAYFRQPNFPATLGCFPASASVHALPSGGGLDWTAEGGPLVETAALHHPGGATGFRISQGSASFAYLTDFEHDGGEGDEAVIRLAHGADLALLDTTFAPDEYAPCRGWGHAHWRAAAELADTADVRSWGLFHHKHDRTDAELAAMEDEVRARHPCAFAARTGQDFELARTSGTKAAARISPG